MNREKTAHLNPSLPRLRQAALIVLLAAALIQMVLGVSLYVNVRRALPVIKSGAAQKMFARVRRPRLMNAPNARAAREVLETVLRQQRPAGLRYIHYLSAHGKINVEVGKRTTPHGFRSQELINWVDIGPRDRMYVRCPPQTLDEPHRRRHVFEMELEPRVVADAVREGRYGLAFWIVGALLTMAGGAAIWWLIGRRIHQESAVQQMHVMAALGEMTSVMAHELRNPLTAAKGQAQLLDEFLDQDPELQPKSAQVVDQLTHLETLTNQMLEFVNSGRIQLSQGSVRVLIDDVCRIVHDPRVVARIDESVPPQWTFDPASLKRALGYLVRDALRCSPPEARGGEVVVDVCSDQERLRIQVRDHGPTVPEDVDYFSPFITTQRGENGLDLAIARQIIAAHRGSIQAVSGAEGGAIFDISLPQQEPDQSAGEAAYGGVDP